MRITTWVLGLLALACGAAQAQDCHLQQYASFTITRTPEGLTLPVKIGGVEKELAFSLGDASNALNTDVAHELDLHMTTLPSNAHVHHNGANIYYSVRAPRITIEGNSFDNVDFLVLPASAPDRLPGEIGTRLLSHADIELDMAASKLNLFSDGHCPGKTVYWTETGFAKVPMEIDEHDYIRVQLTLDGKPVSFALNTEGRSVIGSTALHRIFGLDIDSPGMTLDHVSPTGKKFYRYSFQKLEAEGLGIAHPDILVREDNGRPECVSGTHAIPETNQVKVDALRNTQCFGQADGTLGLSVLGKLHLYISKKEKLLYVTSAAAK
jgi:hypothetical protein